MSPDKIRNIVLVGHSGNGKTSLAEAMLYRAGVVNRPGRVPDGTTVCDSDVEERERGHSLWLSTGVLEWDGYTVNLIDTPGHPDYRGEALLGMSCRRARRLRHRRRERRAAPGHGVVAARRSEWGCRA